jgi:SulP family sulfate permease
MTTNKKHRHWIYRLLPFLTWMKGYRASYFRSDCIAGLTVAVVLIPQSMAYAMLGGLPPFYGLYAAAITPTVAALWGSLRQLAIGPIAIMSLLVLTTLALIVGIQKVKKELPAGLMALLVTTAILFAFHLQDLGISVIEEIPTGPAGFRIPALDFHTMSSLLGSAVVVALVSFAETYSLGRAVSSETKQKVCVDQEFIGQGLANLVGTFFQSYPVSGSLSRTAINYATGAKPGSPVA